MTNIYYESDAGYEWIDSMEALRRAITDSFRNGRRVVAIGIGDFCTLMQARDVCTMHQVRQLLVTFVSSSGFGGFVREHDDAIEFFA